jgi:hypothetical protein
MSRRPLVAHVLLGASVLSVPSLVAGDCKCRQPEKNEVTLGGGNQTIVVKEEQTYRQLAGRVVMYDDRPLENALVEIFDNPDYLLDPLPSPRGDHTQKRVALCRTAADGKFCFHGLPSGIYELRSSIGAGWNVTHVYIRIDTKTGSGKRVRVLMSVGT